MAYSSAEKKALRSVIAWALMSMSALTIETTALILISLSTESVDCSALATEYETRMAHINTLRTREQTTPEKLSGRSLQKLIALASSCIEGLPVRIIELSYSSGSGRITIEAQTADALEAAIHALLMHDQIQNGSLTERTAQSATLGITAWES